MMKMSTYKVRRQELGAALIQNEVKGKKSLKCAMYYAGFSILNENFILPALVVIIVYLSVLMYREPDAENDGEAPGSNYLCQCCDHWGSVDYCCSCTITGDDGWPGNTLGSVVWSISLFFFFAFVLGIWELALIGISFFIFIFTLLWGTECKESFVQGVSLRG